MACTVFDAFRYATESLDTKIFEQASYDSIWLNLIPRGACPTGEGTYFSVFGTGQTEPTTDTGVWTKIDLSAQAVNTDMDTPTEVCSNSWTDVTAGHYEEQYSPEQAQLRGPVVCEKELLFAHNVDQFLSSYQHKLTVRARREWELNYAYHHRRLSRKAVAVPDFEGSFADQEGFDLSECATCELTQEMLDVVADRLMDDGATNPDSNGFISYGEAGPLFTLYISADQSRRILRQNAELREDYRFGDPQTLLARLGATKVVQNFRHLINQKPRRYTCNAGTYTAVPYYANDGNVTKGTSQVTNPDWRTAPYEGADVLSPYLFTSLVVPPRTSGGGGQKFDPHSYMGEWELVVGAYKWTGDADAGCDDPLNQKCRHYAQFMHAPEHNPLAKWKYGYHIIYKRCVGNNVECTTCSS